MDAAAAASSTAAETRSPHLRHAGRAHIRGKIRRVWRPRYLELYDTGWVRYYEMPGSDRGMTLSGSSSGGGGGHTQNMVLDVADVVDHAEFDPMDEGETEDQPPQQQQQPFSKTNVMLMMIPKYTLAIYEARILDMTTFRDLHVGLPRGTFGFVFRGQRLWHNLEKETTLCSTTAHLLGGSGCAGEAPLQDPRDFLCAVPTLEEAQMWVVALQWAAAQAPHLQQPHPSPGTSLHTPLGPSWWTSEADTSSLALSTSIAALPTITTPMSTTPASLAKEATRHEVEDSATGQLQLSWEKLDLTKSIYEEAQSTWPSPAPAPSAAAAPLLDRPAKAIVASSLPLGKVVVTQVVHYRTVRLSGWNQFEIAYEIHGLLLSRQQAEEWSMLRTAQDLEHLIAQLCKELGPSLLDRAQVGLMRQLPRLHDRPSRPTVQASCSVVDGILRKLTMDPALVNATAMRSFLGLSSVTTQVKNAYQRWAFLWEWYALHDPSSVLHRTVHTLPDTMSSDRFVKLWLHQRGHHHHASLVTLDLYAAMLLQRPLMLLGGLGFSTLAIVPLARMWERVVPSVTMRVDVLVFSWLGAAYVGQTYLVSHRDMRSTESLPKVPPVSRRPVVLDREAPPPKGTDSPEGSEVMVEDEGAEVVSRGSNEVEHEESDGEETGDDDDQLLLGRKLGSPLPEYPENGKTSCWSQPPADIFFVRGLNYLVDRIKVPSGPSPMPCRGVDVWMTDNPQRHITRHPAVLGGRLGEEDTFLVNFLLPFGNFVAYFSIPSLTHFPKKLRNVWTKFLKGDQLYRDARLKLLPIVVDGPWIVKTAVGPGKSPALLGKVIPLQYFFRDADKKRKAVYEVDVIITASTIAKGILSVVKGHTKSVSIAFAFIIEAAQSEDLPETVLCSFQVHSLHLEDCPQLPDYHLDDIESV